MPSRRKPRVTPSPSPEANRSQSPAPTDARRDSEEFMDLSAQFRGPFKLRLQLPSSEGSHNSIRRTVCFFSSTSASDLGRAISAAFYGSAQHHEVVALWEHPDDEGDTDAEPVVHTLSGVVAHPELYTGRVYSLTELPQNLTDLAPALDLICTEPEAAQLQPPLSLMQVLAPLVPHPRRNPTMLLTLTLSTGGLLSHGAVRSQHGSDTVSLAPETFWRLTTSSRFLALVLFVVVASGQLRSVLRDAESRRACAQLKAQLTNKLLCRLGGGLGAASCLWALQVFDMAARLAIIGAAHCVSGVASLFRFAMSAVSISWCEVQLWHLAQSIQKLFLPLLEMSDYAAKQLYLHGPQSPILSQSLGFLDLSLDYATQPTARADACQRLSPLRSSDFWQKNMDECTAFIEGKAVQFAASVRGIVVLLVAVWALRRLPTAVLSALTQLPWRLRVALPLALAVLNVAIFMERSAEDTVRWIAVTEPSFILSMAGVGILTSLGWMVNRSWVV